MAKIGDVSLTDRLTIKIVDPDHPDKDKFVTAMYNPKEIQITKKVPWERHKNSKGDSPDLEFTQGEAETAQVELFFDTYESREDVYEVAIKGLRSMCLIPDGPKGKKKHPPQIMVIWNNKSYLNFKGVITNLAVKYTMFLPDGTPVRATATLSLQAAAKVTAKVPPPRPPQPNPPNPPAGGGAGAGSGGTPPPSSPPGGTPA
jgi:hypothetical protein